MPIQIVVAGALIRRGIPRGSGLAGGELLVAQRVRPQELAGRWELPGGKVAPGETERDALARELAEELGITVAVGERLGDDVALSETTTLRAYLVTQTDAGTVFAHDHRELRWVSADELHQLDWVAADRAWLPALTRRLGR